MLESKGRPLRSGDIMILVRHRDALPAALVRSLKARGVPVAGLDRMVLTEQPAVQDLMVLGDALLLPQDDLSFACVLTSPLGGLNDDDLMATGDRPHPALVGSVPRPSRRNAAWSRAWTFFNTLLNRVDYVSPHALFAEALGALGGRAKIARASGCRRRPSRSMSCSMRRCDTPRSIRRRCRAFLQWLRRSGAEIKREAEAAGDQVRILTVHGAKGLQAPLVILPDTTSMPRDDDELLWGRRPGSAGGRCRSGCRAPSSIATVRGACATLARQSRREEYNRLLYVALTRAEDRLVVCGAKPRQGAPNEACWYNLIARGFARLTEVTEGEAAVLRQLPQTRAV